MPSKTKIIFTNVIIITGIIFFTVYQNSNLGKNEIMITEGEEYLIKFPGSDLEIELSTDEGLVVLGLGTQNQFFQGIRYSDESYEYFARVENEDSRISITDENFDGIPDYRLIRNIKTRKTTKEYISSVTWSSEKPQDK